MERVIVPFLFNGFAPVFDFMNLVDDQQEFFRLHQLHTGSSGSPYLINPCSVFGQYIIGRESQIRNGNSQIYTTKFSKVCYKILKSPFQNSQKCTKKAANSLLAAS